MIKNIVLVALIIAIAPISVSALDLRFQPRFKTGIQYYEYEQQPFTTTPARDPQGNFPNMGGNLKFRDWLPFVSGGATFFVDRFFVDFDFQHSFDGQDESNFVNQNFIADFPRDEMGNPIGSGTVLDGNTTQNADFDRSEWAVSVGFEIIENLAIFGGYKKAKTDFNSRLRGDTNGRVLDFSGNLTPITVPFGAFTGTLEQKFEYDGPFAGATYNWRVDQGLLNGVLSFNFAVALMDGNVDLKFGGGASFLESLGESGGGGSFTGLDGDTVGFSFGAAWKGFTPIDGLVYSMGVSGYRYQFNSNDTADFSETQIRIDFSLAYALDFGI